MKILFVTNCNYPYSDTGTNLINRIFFEGRLLDNIGNIDILAGKDRLEDLDFETYKNINIYRTTSWTVLPKEEIFVVLRKNPFLAIQGIIEKVFYYIERKVNKKNFIDRYACRAFYRALKKINAQKYDMIITMSGRYYQTAATLKFCKKTGQKYVFYQVDPCGTNRSFSEESKQSRIKFEKQLYVNAEAIITTPIILEEQKNVMSMNELSNVVEMEFPLISEPKSELIKKRERSKIPVCMFIGSIYGGIRNPDYTIRLFRNLIENNIIEFHFVGVNKKEISEEFKELKLICHGKVELSEAMRLMGQADFLINIGNSVTNQIPSKIFDYISYGKPIINICKSKECPTLLYFEKYPLAINLFEESKLLEKQKRSLEDFIKEKCNEKIAFQEVEKLFIKCTPKYCAKKMSDILEKIYRA